MIFWLNVMNGREAGELSRDGVRVPDVDGVSADGLVQLSATTVNADHRDWSATL